MNTTLIKSTPHNDGYTKVELNLVGLDGNAFNLIGAFKKAAKRQGFFNDWIEEVVALCQSDDYDHLLSVLLEHTTENATSKPAIKQISPSEDSIGEYRPLYWNNEGKYQVLSDALFDELVPPSGPCMDEDGTLIIHAELVRLISRFGYDLYNNGLCNDRSYEAEFLIKHLALYTPYFEQDDSQDFKAILEFYLEELENERTFHGQYEYTCDECHGDGEIELYYDDEAERDVMEVCSECGGSGELIEYLDYEGPSWLDWFTPVRMKALDRATDAIVLYANSIQTK